MYDIITGYASVFNHIDSHKQVILKGAFNQSLNVPILFQHDWNKMIGKTIKIYQDNKGLFIKGILYRNKIHPQNYNLIQNQVINGLSIGMQILSQYQYNNISYVTNGILAEISIVSYPVNELSRINTLVTYDEIKNKFTQNLHELSIMVGNSGLEPPTPTMST